MPPIKTAILTNVILDYRHPIFEALACDPHINLKLFLTSPLSESDSKARQTLPLHYSKSLNFSFRTVHGAVNSEQIEKLPIPLSLFPDLLYFRPQVIISGEFGLRSLFGYAASRLLRVPFVLWSEEIPTTAVNISSLQHRIRKFLIPKASYYLAWGQSAIAYLQTFNVNEAKIVYTAQAVDNDLWRERAHRHGKSGLAELELPGKTFLLVGRHVRRKGFDLFLQAWSDIPGEIRSNHSVILVGEGDETAPLRSLVQELGLLNVHFAGFQSGGDLARYYAAADVFVFPSLVDVWGLVVNEALASGLPVLASKYAGSSQELATYPESSGVLEVFDPLDKAEFTALLSKWCQRNEAVAPTRAYELISRINFKVSIDAFKTAISLCRDSNSNLLNSDRHKP